MLGCSHDTSALVSSYIYCSALLQKVQFEVFLDSQIEKYKLRDMFYYTRCYKLIRERYHGILAGKLTALLVINGKTPGL